MMSPLSFIVRWERNPSAASSESIDPSLEPTRVECCCLCPWAAVEGSRHDSGGRRGPDNALEASHLPTIGPGGRPLRAAKRTHDRRL